MKRKRFVKLLMSRGYCRNDANNIANNVLKSNITYKQAYKNVFLASKVINNEFIKPLKGIIKYVVSFLTEAFRTVSIQ